MTTLATQAPREWVEGASSAPLHVLHVHSGNLWGGVETVLVTLAAERGRCPTLLPEFALCFDGALASRLGAAGARVHRLGAVRWRAPLQVYAARRRVAALVGQHACDIVVTHSMWAHALFAPVLRRSAGLLVHWAHDYVDGTHWLQRLARRTPPDLVLANSTFTAGGVEAVFPSAPVRVVYPPVPLRVEADAPRPERIRAAFEAPPGATVIVQAGRLERFKGHEVLLDALAQLRALPDWECWIVGGAQRPQEHAYLASLRRRAEAARIAARVRFIGQREDVPDVLRAADLFCHPNTAPEGFGLVFVEALAAGLPVVATAIGGACEIVDPTCGELVPPGDATALAAALSRFVQDPVARRARGAAGPARAAHLCDPDRQLQSLVTAFAEGRRAAPAQAR